MSASFGHELLGREIVDSLGDKLGILDDLLIDVETGDVLHMLIRLETDIDPGKLPWTTHNGLLRVPIEVVDRVAAKIHLRP